MRSNFKYVFIWLSICLVSCDTNQIFDEYKTVPNQWNKSEIMQFKISPPDTINAYNLFVNIRNTNDYKYNNLYLIVEMNYPNGKVQKDTIEYRMTTPEGEFLGTGFSDVKENKFWYKQNQVFNENGDYIFKIQHAMRENGSVNGIENLEGVTDIGFRIERPNSNN